LDEQEVERLSLEEGDTAAVESDKRHTDQAATAHEAIQHVKDERRKISQNRLAELAAPRRAVVNEPKQVLPPRSK